MDDARSRSSVLAPLHALSVLVVDAQASGATPAHGDLLELGWSVCTPQAPPAVPVSRWVVPRTTRRVSGPVRELTGWSEACLAEAVSEQALFEEFDATVRALAEQGGLPLGVPTVIHFARFELPFLRDLYQRLAPERGFPLQIVCTHQISERLFPDLPRRNIRALAGFLGHSPGLLRRAAGHVEASAFIWCSLASRLADQGIHDWHELSQWLTQPAARTRSARRSYPLPVERRRALPDKPGVYRFLRPNGDVIYVGKATSLKKRIAGHFRSGGKATERALELLTQVHDIDFTETPSVLEAALLETDQIKALDPPYNLQLKLEDRRAWFVDRRRDSAASTPDGEHTIGPLPSRRALQALPAMVTLAGGAQITPQLQARVLSVPTPWLPEPALFAEGFAAFERELLRAVAGPPLTRVLQASRALWLTRRYAELESDSDEETDELWDLARVRRRLERGLVHSGLLERRARWLCLLSECDLAFRERGMPQPRALSMRAGEITSLGELSSLVDSRGPASSWVGTACTASGVLRRDPLRPPESARHRARAGPERTRRASPAFGAPRAQWGPIDPAHAVGLTERADNYRKQRAGTSTGSPARLPAGTAAGGRGSAC
ncbi:MAG: GIY-YIG nuclease family protein [Myxococcales bacterium]